MYFREEFLCYQSNGIHRVYMEDQSYGLLVIFEEVLEAYCTDPDCCSNEDIDLYLVSKQGQVEPLEEWVLRNKLGDKIGAIWAI